MSFQDPRWLVAAFVAAALAATVAVACGRDAAPEPPPVGGAPPSYDRPQQVTQGEYRSPATDFEVEGLAAQAEDAGKPVFRGTLNGFRFFSVVDGMAPEVPCSLAEGEGLAWSVPDEAHPSPIDPGYLPPGTFALGPVGILSCPDGTLAEAMQLFDVANADFAIRYDVGTPIVVHDAPAERVEAAPINGQPGVIVRPVIPEGWGASQIVFKSGEGYFTILAFDVPLEGALKIAEGLR